METNKGVKLSETIKLQNPFKLPIVIGSYCYQSAIQTSKVYVFSRLQKNWFLPSLLLVISSLISDETWTIQSKQFSNYINFQLNIAMRQKKVVRDTEGAAQVGTDLY